MDDQFQGGVPASNPPPPPTPNRKRQYWFGIAYGTFPLLIFLISGALLRTAIGVLWSISFSIGLVGYLALIVITIIYLFNREKRFIGYGLLTMLLITPVVAVYGCTLISQIS